MLHFPGLLFPPLSSIPNGALHDVLLTKDEYHAMADGLADTEGPSTAPTSLTDWLNERGPSLGIRYANELDRQGIAADIAEFRKRGGRIEILGVTPLRMKTPPSASAHASKRKPAAPATTQQSNG